MLNTTFPSLFFLRDLPSSFIYLSQVDPSGATVANFMTCVFAERAVFGRISCFIKKRWISKTIAKKSLLDKASSIEKDFLLVPLFLEAVDFPGC